MAILESPTSSSIYFDLLNVWRQSGCPVCRLSVKSVKRYLHDLLHENANDPDVHMTLLKSRGFCAEHAGFLLDEENEDGLGASIVYDHIVKSVLRGLTAAISSPAHTTNAGSPIQRTRVLTKLKRAFRSEGRCPACEQRDIAVNRLLDEMSARLPDERIQSALRKSDGLCFHHLVSLLERVESDDGRNFLLGLARQKLEALQADMQALIRKHERPLQTETPSWEEAQAWRKAMVMISGAMSKDSREKL